VCTKFVKRNEKSGIGFCICRNNGPKALTQTLILLILISGLQPHEYMVDRLIHGIRRYLRYFRVYLWKCARINKTKSNSIIILLLLLLTTAKRRRGHGRRLVAVCTLSAFAYLSLSVCRRTWRTVLDWIPRRTPAREHYYRQNVFSHFRRRCTIVLTALHICTTINKLATHWRAIVIDRSTTRHI